MAAVAPIRTLIHDGTSIVSRYVWPEMKAGDVGDPVALSQFPDRAIQVVGDFGVGGKIDIEGSVIDDEFDVMNDVQANPLSFTTRKIEQVQELVKEIRPVCSGNVATNLTVGLILRKS